MKIDEKVKEFIDLRDRRKIIKSAFVEADDELKKEMKSIEMDVLDFLQETGQESAKTAYGVAYKKQNTSFSVSDMQQFVEYVIDNKATDLLYRRVNQTAYKSYLEDDVVVPGINVFTENVITIRKT